MRAPAALLLAMAIHLLGAQALASPGDVKEPTVPVLFERLGPAMADFRSTERRDALLDDLSRRPRDEVLAHLRETALGEVPLHRRLLALRVLGAVRGDASLALVLEISSDTLPSRLESPAVGGAFRSALIAILEDEPDLCPRLRRAWRDLRPGMRTIGLDAMEQGGGETGVRTMADLLGRDTATTVEVLTRLARLPPIRTRSLGYSVHLTVAQSLRADDAVVRRAAALAAGRLHATDAVEQLIAILADPGEQETVRAAAWSALKQISGRRMPPSADQWSEWFRQEQEWAVETLPGLLALLREDGKQVVRVLSSLSSHRMDRHEITSEVIPLLTHPDASVRTAAANCLGSLGELDAIEALLHATNDEEAEVAGAAANALGTVTGLPPRDAEGWRSALRDAGVR